MARPGLANRQHLQQWADTESSRSDLPRLVRKLILETGSGIVQLGFPAGEGVSAGDWDGMVRATEATAFVPAGLSLWELSVQKSVGTKANADYAKRTSTPDGSKTDDCTYVAASLRPWTKREDWAKTKRGDNRWKDVKALGLDDFETWLEDAPVTHAWLSERLGLGPHGLRSAEAWWADWSAQTNPGISADLILAGRDAQVTELRDRLSGPPALTTIQGDSIEEIQAFIAAAAVSASTAGDDGLLARLAFVDDVATWRSLRRHQHGLVLVPVGQEVVEEAATSPVHHVLVPVPHAPRADISVPAIDAGEAANALQAAGLTDERVADRCGRLARRSVIALRRHLASKPELHTPAWAAPPLSRATKGLLFAGRWADSVKGDLEVVAELTGKDGDELRELVEGHAASEDPLIAAVGRSWALVSPFDAWLQMRGALSETDLKRLEKAVRTVLLEKDPALEVPPEERLVSSLQGTGRKYSPDLRIGLATSLTLLGVNGEEVADGEGEAYASYLVKTLLEEANSDSSGAIWASMAYLLPKLAEAAPDAFLDGVRAGTQGEDPVLKKMFQDGEGDSDGFLSSNSPHPNLLWAMELVAWSPDYFGQSVELLARLVELDDPEGTLGNRPRSSLTEIFCPWHPENSVDEAARLAAIDNLRKQHPEVAWRLMLTMLPSFQGVHSPTHEPEFRDWKPPFEPVTNVAYFGFVDEIATRVVEDAGDSAERWKELVDAGSQLMPNSRSQLREGLSQAIERGKFDEAGALALWKELRDFVARNREFSDAKWALPEDDLKELEKLQDALAPDAAAARNSWLFEDHMPDLGLDAAKRENFAEFTQELESQRKKAMTEIEAEGGLEAVIELLPRAANPAFPGWSLADAVSGKYDAELLGKLEDADSGMVEFAAAYFAKRFRQDGWDWLTGLFDEHEVSSKIQGLLLVRTSEYPKAWEVAKERGNDVESAFWQQFMPFGLGPDFEYVIHVAEQLLTNERAATALQLVELYMRGEEKKEELTDDGAQIGKIMADALDSILQNQAEPPEPISMSQYELQRIFAYLERYKSKVGTDRVARLEWAFLPALGYEPSVGLLEEQLASSPEFFVQVVSAVYRPSSSKANDAPKQDESVARNGWRLLSSWKRVPGKSGDKIDGDALRKWVSEAQAKLDEADRREVGEIHIGHVLAFAPGDPDGSWPCETVRDLLEELQSENVEEGLRTQIFNNRGITSRSPLAGGDQERELEKKYDDAAKSFASKWPRIAAVLRDLAKSYKRQAKMEDREAERRRQGLDP